MAKTSKVIRPVTAAQLRREVAALKREYATLQQLLSPLIDRIRPMYPSQVADRGLLDIVDMRRGVNHLHDLVRQQGDDFSTRLKRLEDELLRQAARRR